MRKLTLTTAVVMAIAFGAQPAIAQQLSMSILNSGKAPDAPIPVKVVEDGQETLVATADRRGNAEVDFSVIAAGSDVCVKIVNGEIHLVPKGDGDCDDDAIGIIPWGETTHINVDTGTGAFSTGMATSSFGYRPWRVGLGIDYAKLTNLEDTGCLNAQSCDADDTGIGYQAYLEYDVAKNWHVGLGATYRSFTVNQDFGGGDVSQVDVDVLGAGLYGGFHMPVFDRSRLSVDIGPILLRNEADILSNVGGQNFQDSRSESGLRLKGAANIDWGLSDKWSMRLGAGYVAGDEDDADSHFYGGLSVIASF